MPADLIARGLAATDAELGLLRTNPRYRVYLRDAGHQLVDEITDWIGLKLISRFNAIGTWTLELSRRSVLAAQMTRSSGIVVKRDGRVIFSGSVSTEYTLTAQTLRVAGECDMALLRAPALPTPLGPPYTDEYDVRTGTASTVMRQLVDANIGPGARADRRVAAVTLGSDPGLGSVITSRARFDPLITLLAELALTPYAGGLRFTLQQSDTVAGALELAVTAPQDRSGEAKFSIELGTAQDFEDTQSAPGANYVYVSLGDDLGANRTILEDGDAASIAIWGRREAVVDKRGVTDTSEGEQALAEALAGATTARKVTLTPFSVKSLEYGVDYDLGDLVQFAVDGTTYPAIIREVEVDLTTDRGAVITPMIGDAGATNDDRAAQQLAAIEGRISNVERNWNVPDNSILPVMLGTIDVPAANEVVTYDAPTGRLKWFTLSELLAVFPVPSLAVIGNATIGGTLGVTGAITGASTVQGTRLISTVGTGTAPLQVSSTTVVPNLNASLLGGLARTGFAELAGAAFTGNVSVSTNALNVDAAGNKVRINSASVTGWDLTVGSGGILAEGASRFQGAVTVSTGGVDVTGASTFRAAVTVTTGGVDVTGSSTFHNAVTVSAGGINVTGSSVFASGVSVTTGGVTVNGGGIDVTGSSTFRAAVTVTTGGVTVSAGGASITGTVTVTGAFSASLSSSFGAGLSIAGGLTVTTGAVSFPNTSFGAFGSAANTKQTVTGSRGGNAALASFLSAMANYGWIADSSTA